MLDGVWVMVAMLLAAGGGAALTVVVTRRRLPLKERPDPNAPTEERWETRRAKFKKRLATLESAVAKAEHDLTERQSGLSRSDPDRALRTFLETEHPRLADPATPDLYKVEWLRHWVYQNIPHCKYGQDLDPVAFDIVHHPITTVLRELVERRSGFLCGGMAWVLYRLCEVFGYPGCTLNMGGLAHGTSHMVAVVEIQTEHGPLWSVQDPYFDFTLEDGRGHALDVRRAMEYLSRGRVERLHLRDTDTPKSLLVLPTNVAAIERIEASGAREIDGYGAHRRFVHPHSASTYRAWHPEAIEQIRNHFGQDHLFLLLLIPLQIHGDDRFHTLHSFAADKLREYREGQSALYLIYSIGKTGTQTIEQSLLRAGLPGNVRRTHFLSRKAIRENSPADGRGEVSPSQASMHTQAAHARSIRRLLVCQRSFRHRTTGLPPVRVICGVREPVAQLLSRLFQDPLRYLGAVDGFTPEQVSDAMERLVLNPFPDAAAQPASRSPLYFTDWFENELHTVFRLDVYQTPFAREDGCQVFEAPSARVMVYRQEDLTRLSAVLAGFVGVERLALVDTNVRRKSGLRELYERCLRECRFSFALLDTLYGSRYARHFYSPQEIDGFRARWQSAFAGIGA